VVKGVDMEVHRGQVVVIFGRSGSGKSTVLRCVNFIEDPTAGSIEVAGIRLAGGHRTRRKREQVRQLRLHVGMVFQQFNLFPNMTVLDNVTCAPRCAGVSGAECTKRAKDLLDRVGLADKADQHPYQLSGGQQQRVGVARGLVTDPNILLMDEPFGAVDPIVRDELQQELLRLQRELDKTIVFVTHDIDEAFLLGDQVVILKKGAEVAQVGSPADILAKPADDFVRSFVGLDKGHRKLHVEDRDGTRIVVDETGKATGVLSE
jgi:osmoprotectant transport system ATP-binding protein